MLQTYCKLLLLTCVPSSLTKYLPDFITVCTNDANLSECSQRVLESLRPHLVRGALQELDVPQIDRLRMPKPLTIRRSSNIADYTANVTNLVWVGVENYEVKEIAVDPDKLAFRLLLGFPRLQADLDADLDGVIVNFPMQGTGIFTLNYTDVSLDMVMSGELYEHDGKTFVRWQKEDVAVSYEDVYIAHVDGFFQDSTLTQLFKMAVNKASRILNTSLRTPVDWLGTFIVDIVNRIHELFPKDVLYPSCLMPKDFKLN